MILVVVITLMVVGLAAAYLALTAANDKMTYKETMGTHAIYTAEAALALTVNNLNAGQIPWETLAPTNTGAVTQTQSGLLAGAFGTGAYDVTIACWGYDQKDNNGDGVVDESAENNFMTISSLASVGEETRQVRAHLTRTGGGVFWNVLFAGNNSGSAYTFGMTGQGTNPNTGKADTVTGDVYINGNLNVDQQANINGNVMVTGNANDTSSAWNGAYSQGYQGPPDLASMDYPNNNDVNVSQSFASNATYGPAVPNQNGNTSAGGSAYQITDENDPAHIFRKNPDDNRIPGSVNNNGKDNYFLEDPNQGVHNDPNWNGSDATKIKILPNGNNKVYYIDGNLWIHNHKTYSFKLWGPGLESTGIKLTIVVKGNIYISDNIFYNNVNKDGLILISMKDPNTADSGNIYFGDPLYGTVEDFEAFMFAENNFYTTNISASASKIIATGNMTAGNMLVFNLGTGNSRHPLKLTFDDRIMTGQLNMPGVPPPAGGAAGTQWHIAAYQTALHTEGPAMTGP